MKGASIDWLLRGLAVGILAANIAAVIALWHGANLPLLNSGLYGGMIAYGRLAGLLLECAILLQLVLIARIPLLERAFGFDKMNKLHRYIGYSIAILFLFHPGLLTWGYARTRGFGLIQQFFDFLYNWEDVAKAVFAVFILAAIIVFTVLFRKKVQYETWHGFHLFSYVAIALAFGHQINFADVSYGGGLYRWLTLNFVVFGLLLFYRVLWPLILWQKHRFYVKEIQPAAADTYSILIGGRKMDKFKFVPGQFAQWFFLAKNYILPHPFSFSKAADGETVRVTIKNSGDFTARIKDIPIGTPVMIDGPLGRFTARAARREKYLLIAGGIGITPIRAMSEEIADANQDAVVLYSARKPENFALAEEIPSSIRLHKFVSDSNAVIPAEAGIERGMIDIDSIRRLVPDFTEREIYICGPVRMMDALSAALRAAGAHKKQIHMERFAF